VHAFRRTFSSETISRAFGIFILSVAIIIAGTAGRLGSEVGGVSHGHPTGSSQGQIRLCARARNDRLRAQTCDR
jgi:hypothetical protein